MDIKLTSIYLGQKDSGKTNIVLGLAVRASGAGFRIWFAQYLEKDREICENFQTLQKGMDGRYEFFSRERLDENREGCLCSTLENVSSGKYDLVILDGILEALKENELSEIIDQKNERTELVLTGTEVSSSLQAKVQLVTKIRYEN